MLIIKRDNTRQAFNLHKIYEAVFMAASDANQDYADASQIANDTTQRVIHRLQVGGCEEATVYELEQLVEDTLMSSAWKDVARKYIEYRHDRQQARDLESDLYKNIVGLVDQTNSDVLHENANKESAVFHVQRDLLAGEVSRHYALNYLLPREISREHISGNIHFHDLDYFPMMGMTNCSLVDLEGMLSKGFKMGNARIERPKSIQTAATIVSQIAAAVASSQYGGTSFDRLDEVLAPYVTMTYNKEYERSMSLFRRFTGTYMVVDELALQCIKSEARIATKKAVFDACQTLEYQVNTIYSTNGQTPFLTFGFGLGTSWEAKLVQEGILQTRIAGLGKEGTTPIFPKLVFGLKEGLNLNPEDPNYDIKQLALECASTRIYPDVLNYDKTVEITGGYKAPMGCRSFLSYWEDDSGKETYAGRNNLGVVSLNIPKIALEAQLDYDKFWGLLDDYCEIAHKGLQYRLERLSTVKANSAPIMYMEGALGLYLDPEEFVLPHLLKRGASISLGYLGLEEAANAMLGSLIHTYDEPEKQQFALDIVKFLDKKTKEWKEAEGVAYSVYATPSESLCNRFCKAIVREYGEFEGVTDKGYLTNSFHLDVTKKVNPYDKIDFEAQFIPYSSGGHICYGEFPSLRHNIKALEDVWDYAYRKVPYYGTNTPIDECYECGFKGEFNCTSEGFKCPKCGNKEPDKCSVTRRVCGYLGNPGTRPFNEGKQSEMTKRVKHI